MAEKTLQNIKVQYCHHANAQVALQAELVYPADWLPDQPPRVLAHRCSHGLACNLDGRASCVWAGTNPAFDPSRPVSPANPRSCANRFPKTRFPRARSAPWRPSC